MPPVGVSVDRRALRHLADAYNSARVRQMICLVCAQSKTDMGIIRNRVHATEDSVNVYEENVSDIAYRSGKDLWKCFARHRQSFELN